MLWKFQKEIALSLLMAAALFLLHLGPSESRPQKNTEYLIFIDYQEAFVRELTLENQRLRNLLKLKEQKPGVIATFGEVIALDPIGWPIWITVEARSAERVRTDLTVLDRRGNLVGRVAEKEGRQIKVMTVLNPKSRISVTTQESRYLGILESTGPLHLSLGYLPNESRPVAGETIITSKMSQNYLPGIPVGIVQKSAAGKGFFREVIVRPKADFSSLEEVLIAY